MMDIQTVLLQHMEKNRGKSFDNRNTVIKQETADHTLTHTADMLYLKTL